MSPFLHRGALSLLVAPVLLAACDGGTAPSDPVDEPLPELTVDAADDWAFVALGDPATEVAVADRPGEDTWDVGFFATSVMLNGGDAGPGDVEGVCLCANEGLSDAAVVALTEADGLAAFEAVTVADVPSGEDAWEGDTLVPSVDGWWSYDVQTHTVSADPEAVFKLRTAGGSAFAKLHVTAITGATQQDAGTVTLEFAVQDESGAPFGDTRTLEVDVSGGAAAVDLETASIVATGSEGWDLELSGYQIRVNGGVSGDGQAGAVRVDEAFESVEDAGDLTSRHYRGDTFGGVFATGDPGRRWYRYNLEGNHQIWPTQNVYLIRTGGEVYKAQIVGYYHPDTGDSRHITLRYARLEP